MDYDLLVIGSGPGGYVAAIRASQLNMKVAVVEKSEIGGICLNWGCIPTKSLLKSAQVLDYINHAEDYGIRGGAEAKPDFGAIVARSRGVAEGMSKGIQYLFRKNNIELLKGFGALAGGSEVEVTSDDGSKKKYSAGNIIIATGARSKELPGLKQDGRKIIGYREAMTLPVQPETMVVAGSGAIGSEFAYFYQTIGTSVTLVEFMPRIVPNEDEEVSRQLERSFKKVKMRVLTGSSVESADTSGDKCRLKILTPRGYEELETDIVLSAVGVETNITGIGLELAGVRTEKGKVVVDDYYRTNVPGIFAIGDIVHGPALAHVASAEGIACVEKIAGLDPEPVDYSNIPSCIYTTPEIASCGMTEAAAKAAGREIRVGKFPFAASGKANASGSKEGFVKLIFDASDGELLGAHMIGANVTEMISELVVARKLETTAHEIIKSVHPHPTMSEAIMEAAAAAYGEVIHL
ncbi:MAG TPA: dihydrolipoyl dehydrogenase [Bacteroidales bacterium]|jgi:dihydrolipoamide dehydrogenase|nr:dihydrolipoyl dehydrogenase [Bacteroidales bacterium]HNY52145.1 dihydrolipoyl dehydrogenase [Bacteroidales bacterium]HOG55706.1 dihydrolipoyl dehydrogenase [Bacteroidales bacterium]HPB12287.1 dihydrolipoyl dehydrogenase [Bacteroidales bacterium]HPX42751.1 dihydrolipoyl dehydrogenase [Bacteroidales bacterium]